jgi:tight adherence protein C
MPVTSSIIALLVIVGGLVAALVGAGLSLANPEQRRLARYLAEPAQAADARPDPLAYRQVELRGSLRERLLLPGFRSLAGILGRMTPNRSIERLGKQLAAAGNPLGLRPREFYGFQLLFLALAFFLAYQMVRSAPSPQPSATRPGSALRATEAPAGPRLDLLRVSEALFVLFVGARLPSLWLRRAVRGRQNQIRRNLPDALDMLSVCAEAGLGFDQSLQRVSERWKTPLGKEFARVVQEMSMGLTRGEALRGLADRVTVPELSSFVTVILQSEQMGMSITDVLRAQAEQMRIERRHRAQEEARKAPLKMLFPMLLLILPALMGVVIGPAIPALMDVFQTVMGGM